MLPAATVSEHHTRTAQVLGTAPAPGRGPVDAAVDTTVLFPWSLPVPGPGQHCWLRAGSAEHSAALEPGFDSLGVLVSQLTPAHISDLLSGWFSLPRDRPFETDFGNLHKDLTMKRFKSRRKPGSPPSHLPTLWSKGAAGVGLC